MSEKDTNIEPQLLTPEYWNGHNPEDECIWKATSGIE